MPSETRVVDYCVVAESQTETLEKKVRELLKDGWVPHGSLSVVAPVMGGDVVAPLYSQAMVRRA